MIDKTGPYGNSAEDTGIAHPLGGLVQTAVQKLGLPSLREKLRVSNYTSHTHLQQHGCWALFAFAYCYLVQFSFQMLLLLTLIIINNSDPSVDYLPVTKCCLSRQPNKLLHLNWLVSAPYLPRGHRVRVLG